MIKLKVKQKITDSVENKKLLPGETHTVSKERLAEMRERLGKDFNAYFEVIEIKKKKS